VTAQWGWGYTIIDFQWGSYIVYIDLRVRYI